MQCNKQAAMFTKEREWIAGVMMAGLHQVGHVVRRWSLGAFGHMATITKEQLYSAR